MFGAFGEFEATCQVLLPNNLLIDDTLDIFLMKMGKVAAGLNQPNADLSLPGFINFVI